MRHPFLFSLCMFGAVATAACNKPSSEDVDRKIAGVNVIDATNLNDVMLTVADPNESVAYFQRAASDDPDRIDHLRGLASSLVRAKRATEAVSAWQQVTQHPDATDIDRVDLADANIRANNWKEAEAVLDRIPPTHESYKRYRLEAMIADSNRE